MKISLVCFFCLSFALFTPISAQDVSSFSEQIIADIFEQYTAENETETIDYESFYDQLMELAESPMNLNETSREELVHLPFLNTIQIENILAYIYRFGKINTIYELQLIEGLDMTDIRRMLPFVVVGEKKASIQHIYTYDLLHRSKNEVLLRSDFGLEKKAGYKIQLNSDITNPVIEPKYAGNPLYNSFKYHFRYKDRIMAGVTAEKDAGEQFSFRKNYGYDFYSAYFQLNDIGRFKRIVAGDFKAGFGMGLVLNTNFGMGKSSYVLNIGQFENGLKKFSSTDEYNFFRGLGTTVQFGKFNLTAFYSSKQIGGDTLNGQFSSIYKTGYHRTDSEINKKRTTGQHTVGMNGTIMNGFMKIGVTMVYTKFTNTLVPDKTAYNYFYFSGKRQTVAGVNYKLHWHKFNFFGEMAITDQFKSAMINGVSFSPASTISFVLVQRNYSPEFDNLFANSFGESSRVNNEKGIYMGAEVRPYKFWKISAYADSYNFQWPKYGIDAPTSGKDFLLQTDFSARKNLSALWRLKYEVKGGNVTNADDILPAISMISKFSFKQQVLMAYNSFKFKNGIDLNLFQKGTANCSYGVSAFQDLSYEFSKIPLKIDFRYQFFDAEQFENGIYTYEKDILYAFSIPVFYGIGSRYYLNLKYEMNKNLSLWFKIAQTVYANERETIGTGNETILGNRKTDVRCLLKWEL